MNCTDYGNDYTYAMLHYMLRASIDGERERERGCLLCEDNDGRECCDYAGYIIKDKDALCKNK